MPITLTAAQLYSRRTDLLNRLTGVGGQLIDAVKEVGGRILKSLTWGNLRGFLVGAILAQLPNMFWSLTNLWSTFTTAAIELYYFDWNVPDSTLDAQAQQSWNIFGSLLGGTAGQALGYFACGIVPGTSLMAFDERLAMHVLREVGQEAYEELSYQFAYALRLTMRNLTRQAAHWLYKGARRWLKQPGNPFARALFGSRTEQVQSQWGAANAQPWSFAMEVEEAVEKIPNFFWQNFTEELIEEALDSCIEAGYVVAQSIEGYYAERKASEALQAANHKIVEITPNKANDAEKIVLAGPEAEIRGQIPSILAHHQMIEDRDLGQLVGQPLDDYIRPRPFEGLRLHFKLYSVSSPPYARRGQERLVEVNIQIADVERSKLDWARLVQVCGGKNGYLWGRFRAHAILTNGRPLTAYGGTPDEAKDRLRAFLTLSDAEIRTLSVTEEIKEAARLENPKLYKETTRVYPAYVTIINRERLLAFDRGQRSREGNFIDKRARIDLWRQTEPADFEEVISELLRRSDVTSPSALP